MRENAKEKGRRGEAKQVELEKKKRKLERIKIGEKKRAFHLHSRAVVGLRVLQNETKG